jgi:hypothetical protein
MRQSSTPLLLPSSLRGWDRMAAARVSAQQKRPQKPCPGLAPCTSPHTRPAHEPASGAGCPERRLRRPKPSVSPLGTSENIATGAPTSQERKGARHPVNEQVTARETFFAVFVFSFAFRRVGAEWLPAHHAKAPVGFAYRRSVAEICLSRYRPRESPRAPSTHTTRETRRRSSPK